MDIYVKKLEDAKVFFVKELRDHSFNERCRNGRVSIDELKVFLVQHGLYNKDFIKYLCAMMSNLETNSHIMELAENLFCELGLDDSSNSRPHYKIYAEMLRRFDLDLSHAEPLPGTQALRQEMLQQCRAANPSFGLGALCLGAEALVPSFYTDIISGFQHCGVGDEALEFFSLHVSCDDKHAETIRDIMAERAAENPAEIENMVRAGRRLVDARAKFLTSIEAHCQGSGATDSLASVQTYETTP